MLSRKFISIVIALSLNLSLLLSSAASAESVSEEKLKLMRAAGEIPAQVSSGEENARIKKDQAIEIAKSMLDDKSRYELGNVFYNQNWGMNRSTWNIDFYSKSMPGGNANAAVDAQTGEVLSFGSWDNYDGQQNYVAKYTRSEAQKLAEKYLKDKFKIATDTLVLQEENPYVYNYRMGGVKEQVIYNFNYLKKVNGITFTNYNISIGVDGSNGKIRNYYSNPVAYDPAKLPSVDGVITSDAALDKLKDTVNVALQYITTYADRPYGGPASSKIMLAYVPASYINMIDAFTGKGVNYDGSEIVNPNQDVTQDNILPLDPNAKLDSREIDEKGAKAIADMYKARVEQFFGIKFEDNNNMGYSKPYYDQSQGEIYNYNWNMFKDGDNCYLNIAINGKTGHVTNFSVGRYPNEPPMPDGKQKEINEKVSWQAGKDKAMQVIKQLAPEQYGFFTDQSLEMPVFTKETMAYMREYSYNFVRIVNGIRYRDNNMSVSIDRESGDVRNFYFNWNDGEFPAAEKVVDKETAVRTYFGNTQAQLSYFVAYVYDKAAGREKQSEPRLVYTFSNKGLGFGSLMVDAVTGKLIDWSGREMKPATTEEPSLADHWAKRSTELLIAQGIIKDPFLNYDGQITRMDAVRMLSLAKGSMYYGDPSQYTAQSFKDVSPQDENYFYVENAVRYKILTKTGGNLNGSEKITKDEFVQLLANLMGYGEIAKHKEIFNQDNINASADAIGSAAVCKALEVLPVEPGKTFDGSAPVTFAEASVALYKALSFVR